MGESRSLRGGRQGEPGTLDGARSCDVLVVGGGPAGLFLGALLAQQDVDVVVLERRPEASTHSRAIGLHPPALAALHTLGLEEAAVADGVRIHGGVARRGGRELGGVTFRRSWPERPFVLALPQYRTEALLTQRLVQLRPDALHRGSAVVSTDDDGTAGVVATVRPWSGDRADPEEAEEAVWRARVVVGADGPHSLVRDRAGIPARARVYPHTYLMGDFSDGTGDGPTAVIYLEEGGVVESFPLPGGVRRWVAHTGPSLAQPSPQVLADLVQRRTGQSLDVASNSMVSAFSVRRRLARRMVAGRQVLVGDAAHEISPIGGQGMTLGWLDALALAPLLVQVVRDDLRGPLQSLSAFVAYEQGRRRAARRAARQAEVNMAAGRPLRPRASSARELAVRGVLSTPLRQPLASAFTMRSL